MVGKNWDVNVGGGIDTPPDISFSWSPNECSRSQNINYLNIDGTLTVERQNIFDLIARDNHPTNFGCINVSSTDL